MIHQILMKSYQTLYQSKYKCYKNGAGIYLSTIIILYFLFMSGFRFSSTVKEDLEVLATDVTNPRHLEIESGILQGAVSRSNTDGSFEDMELQFSYLLVEEYCSLQTEKALGYPAYDEDKFVIGFFSHLTPTIDLDHYIPIEQLENEFDHADQIKAACILSKAIESRSKTFYCIKDYKSLHSLLEIASSDKGKNVKSV